MCTWNSKSKQFQMGGNGDFQPFFHGNDSLHHPIDRPTIKNSPRQKPTLQNLLVQNPLMAGTSAKCWGIPRAKWVKQGMTQDG